MKIYRLYDPIACTFLPDRSIMGVCPKCAYDTASGDECESCGAIYDQLELINPISLLTGELQY